MRVRFRVRVRISYRVRDKVRLAFKMRNRVEVPAKSACPSADTVYAACGQ